MACERSQQPDAGAFEFPDLHQPGRAAGGEQIAGRAEIQSMACAHTAVDRREFESRYRVPDLYRPVIAAGDDSLSVRREHHSLSGRDDSLSGRAVASQGDVPFAPQQVVDPHRTVFGTGDGQAGTGGIEGEAHQRPAETPPDRLGFADRRLHLAGSGVPDMNRSIVRRH